MQIQQFKDAVAALETEATNFYEKGNSSAGTRARNILQEIRKGADAMRKDIQAKKNEKKAAK